MPVGKGFKLVRGESEGRASRRGPRRGGPRRSQPVTRGGPRGAPGVSRLEGDHQGDPRPGGHRRLAPDRLLQRLQEVGQIAIPSTSGTSTASTASPTCRNASTTAASGSRPTVTRAGAPVDQDGGINCYFTAPSSGNYLCTAALQSYPRESRAGGVPDRQLQLRTSAVHGNDLPTAPVLALGRGTPFPDPTGGRRVLLPQPDGVEGLSVGGPSRRPLLRATELTTG